MSVSIAGLTRGTCHKAASKITNLKIAPWDDFPRPQECVTGTVAFSSNSTNQLVPEVKCLCSPANPQSGHFKENKNKIVWFTKVKTNQYLKGDDPSSNSRVNSHTLLKNYLDSFINLPRCRLWKLRPLMQLQMYVIQLVTSYNNRGWSSRENHFISQ